MTKLFTCCDGVGGTTFENDDCVLWINGNDWLVKLAATPPVGFASTTETPIDLLSILLTLVDFQYVAFTCWFWCTWDDWLCSWCWVVS